jgi:hypothetical protein
VGTYLHRLRWAFRRRHHGADARSPYPGHPAGPAGDDRSSGLFWGLIVSFWIGNIFLVILNIR